MTPLTRFAPFRLAGIDPFGDIDDLFKGFLVRPARLEGQPEVRIKMDM